MDAIGRSKGRAIGVGLHSESKIAMSLIVTEDGIDAVAVSDAQLKIWVDADDPGFLQSELRGTWRHFKGGTYTFVGVACDRQAGESLVVYTDADGQVWLRPGRMIDERVERDSGPRFRRCETD